MAAQLAIHEGGMSHLNEHQRRALVAHVGDGELTKESLSQAAKDLGFPDKPPTPASTTTTTDPNPNPNPTPTADPTTTPDETQDPSVAQSLTDLDDIEKAHITAWRRERGIGVSTTDYDEAMAKADSPEAVMAVINSMGPSVGIVTDEGTH